MLLECDVFVDFLKLYFKQCYLIFFKSDEPKEKFYLDLL